MSPDDLRIKNGSLNRIREAPTRMQSTDTAPDDYSENRTSLPLGADSNSYRQQRNCPIASGKIYPEGSVT